MWTDFILIIVQLVLQEVEVKHHIWRRAEKGLMRKDIFKGHLMADVMSVCCEKTLAKAFLLAVWKTSRNKGSGARLPGLNMPFVSCVILGKL